MKECLNFQTAVLCFFKMFLFSTCRPTFVHKFCIKNTIEESIFTATSTDTEKWDRNKVTLGQLKNLFEKVELSETSGSEEHNDDSMIGNVNNGVVTHPIVNVAPLNEHLE